MKPTDTDSGTRRKIELVVISDVHLGTYGCHAKELVRYLKSIAPERLVLNGDIIDMWQFSKNYFPKSHMKVLKEIIRMASKGIPVHYITGNHDEMLRRFAGFQLGNLRIENKLILELDGKKAWIFHGDVFDVTMHHARWLTKLGSVGYDMLILLNASVNFILEKAGREKISLSKRIKNGVKQAVKFINRFETLCAEIAIRNRYDYVVCGHIHQPEIRPIVLEEGEVLYLNSGDWVENLTALEYNEGKWSLHIERLKSKSELHDTELDQTDETLAMNNKELLSMLLDEIHGEKN